MRVVQPEGSKGSLKWIQRAVNARAPTIEQPLLERLPRAKRIDWRSPLLADQFAEYRDSAFLELLGLGYLVERLADFWPARGPQWDALGVTDAGQVLLVEAKAHIREFCTPASQASDASIAVIRTAFAETANALGVREGEAERWHVKFYQYANRLAHLVWMRQQGIDAHLIMANFCGDPEMPGPSTPEAWEATYQVADYALGIPRRHTFSRYIHHVCADVAPLQ
jgi:hypothetical protein